MKDCYYTPAPLSFIVIARRDGVPSCPAPLAPATERMSFAGQRGWRREWREVGHTHLVLRGSCSSSRTVDVSTCSIR